MGCSAIGSSVMLILSLLAVPLAAEAQPAGKVYRLGILSPAAVPRSRGGGDREPGPHGPARTGLC